MAYIGKIPAAAALTSSDIADSIITEAKMADDAISLTELKAGTDGEVISWDASGNPVAIGAGTSGHFLKSQGAGSQPVFAAAGGTGKKNYHFTMATRTAGNSGANTDQFTITSSFTPSDPVNNDLFCICAVPTISDSQSCSGFGLRFSKSGGSDYDFFGRGVQYPDISHNAGQSIASQYFNITAGTIPAGTYTIKLRNETANSHSNYYNPNSTDNARIGTQTQTELMIQEWKN